jgi:hypothetical protein
LFWIGVGFGVFQLFFKDPMFCGLIRTSRGSKYRRSRRIWRAFRKPFWGFYCFICGRAYGKRKGLFEKYYYKNNEIWEKDKEVSLKRKRYYCHSNIFFGT